MRIKLLERINGHKAGQEWNCPSASAAAKLIAEGKALAVEPCDLHLNPAAIASTAGGIRADETALKEGLEKAAAAVERFARQSDGQGMAPDGDPDGDGPAPKRRRKKRGA